MRWLILIHRYVGIGIGWLLVAWCLSGIVMMYVAYPEVTTDEELSLLPRLNLSSCCNFAAADDYLGNVPIRSFTVEMLGSRPVARMTTGFGAETVIDLITGKPLEVLDATAALNVAGSLWRQSGQAGAPRYLGPNERDQWTVAGYFDRDRPLHHFALDDGSGTQWYISSTTGSLVQQTTKAERGWNWIGAVVHWSYPTLLRQNTALWIRFIIWTTLIGTFMSIIGIYIGIVRLRRRRSGRWSPYRGLAWWHHYLGLVFGILTLTWIVSGLLSVNPWGLLEGSGAGREALALNGIEMSWTDVETTVRGVGNLAVQTAAVRIESAPFAGQLYALTSTRDGRLERRLAATGELSPLKVDHLQAAVPRLMGDARHPRSAEILHHGDDYYFDHHSPREFPVFRVIADDPESTRYYLSAATGRLLQKIDSQRRWYRWLFEGLHRFDFAWIRQRPAWDFFLLVLLIGVTAVCATGTYMGFRFLARRV